MMMLDEFVSQSKFLNAFCTKAKKLCNVFIIHAIGICLLLLLSLLKNITVKILHNLRTKSETKQLQPER